MCGIYIIYAKYQDVFFVETSTGHQQYNTMKELVEAYPEIMGMQITIVNYY